MIALDTNVLVRLIVGDSPAEQQAAGDLIAGNACSVSWTVLVELCWVLESVCRLPRGDIAAALGMLAELHGVSVPDQRQMGWAIARYAEGADFADMIHLVTSSATAPTFATFDRKLTRQAGAEAPMEIRTLRGAEA